MSRLASTLILLVLLASPVHAQIHEPYRLDPEIWQRAVLTEMMVYPVGVPAETGQWIEIRNFGAEPVNLQGMVILTSSGGFHVISPGRELSLAPGEIIVMGRSSSILNNGGLEIDYTYGDDLLLSNEDDVILLLLGSALVDFTGYGSDMSPIEAGRSLSLEPPVPGSSGFKEWCSGRASYGDAGNRGTPGQANQFCDNDGDGFAEDEGDCDDDDATVYPGAAETCNGRDGNCDGSTDEDLAPPAICGTEGVCGDVVAECRGAAGWHCPYPATYQQDETICDGLDNDCNGQIDEGLEWEGLALGAECQGSGRCGPGRVVCAPTDEVATCSTLPNGTEPEDGPEICNGLDDDCNGLTDEGFNVGAACQVGLGACARSGVIVCDGELSTRCNAPEPEPEPERCGDGIDNNCNGLIDEGYPEGEVCSVGLGACRAFGKYRCSDDGYGVICSAIPLAPATEYCEDGIDNDCNGLTDEEGCAPTNRGSSGCSSSGVPASAWLFAIFPGMLLLLGCRRIQRSASRHSR
jgi:hypothetical protein